MSVDGLVRNPTGVGGFVPGRSGNPKGRPLSATTAQLYMLRYFREAADLLIELMRTGTKEDAVRLAAIREVLDRGIGRPTQSVSMDLNIDKPLQSMTEQELQSFRQRYAAITTASPVLLDQVIAEEERTEPELPLGATNDGDGDDAGGAAADGGVGVSDGEPRRAGIRRGVCL
jgi:hypothetical protein